MFSGQIEFEPSDSTVARAVAQSSSGAATGTFGRCDNFETQITPRQQLRSLTLNDAPALFALVARNRHYLMQWLPWPETTQVVDDTRQFIRESQHRAQHNQELTAAICYDGVIAGVISLNDIHWGDLHTSIGYWIAQDCQGKGLVTQACKALIDYAFNQLELNRIVIFCASQNTRSRAIPVRLGFTHEGTLREIQRLGEHYLDHEIYALLKREWPICSSV